MTVRKMYSNIEEISAANATAGFFWFSPDTVRFFAGRVESRVYDDGKGGRVWVDSIHDQHRIGAEREYKIARFNTETMDISRIDVPSGSFRTKQAALDYLTDNLI